jgi:hypothetical protein
MTFSFDATLSNDTDLVRFHIGDTDEDGYFLEDETIAYWVSQGNSESATIACIRYILSQLSRPNFSLDWLTVSGMADAKKGYEELLREKEREFGLRSIVPTSTISQPYRADSLQDTDDDDYPDYHSEFDDDTT